MMPDQQRRFLCAYFPEWSVELARRATQNGPLHKQPLALVEKRSNLLVVRRAASELRLAGVADGMPLTLARALIPAIRVRRFDPVADFKTLYQLALWSIKFTPLVGIDGDLVRAYTGKQLSVIGPQYTGLILDLTGTERLHRGEQALLSRLSAALQKHTLTARLAIAPTIGAAWALSRFHPRPPVVINSAELKSSLGALPVAALRLAPETITSLHELGIAALAELWKLPVKLLARRFGSQLITRLDQLTGAIAEPFAVVKPVPFFTTSQEFEFPLAKLDSVCEACLRLLSVVFGKLAREKKKAGGFLVTLKGLTNEAKSWTLQKEVALASASKNSSHLAALLHAALERLRLPGPVVTITITAQSTEPAFEWQRDFLKESSGEIPPTIGEELLNNYVVRLGREHVMSLALHQSYIPERSFSYMPSGAARAAPAAPNWHRPDRPPHLLAKPEAITTISLLPDSPPSWIRWSGRSYKILQGLGPERIAAEWWRGDLEEALGSRDYFRVQDELGRWLWIYRDNRGERWFVQGIWV